MRESLEKYGHLQPKIFYTDNPSTDKHFLETIFELLKADVVPVKVHPTLQPFTCKGNLAVLRLITQASKGGSKENI
jgi:hypothetical protein